VELLRYSFWQAKVLKYHLLQSRFSTQDIRLAGAAQFAVSTMIENENLFLDVNAVGIIRLRDGGFSTAEVLRSDLLATNGIVHIVDAVLLPSFLRTTALFISNGQWGVKSAVTSPPLPDVVPTFMHSDVFSLLWSLPQLSTFKELVKLAEMEETFRNHVTVLAPCNHAFTKHPMPEAIAFLIKRENRPKLV
jgi:uncharacterized surface protein with fasciclin (FAS1) repeats